MTTKRKVLVGIDNGLDGALVMVDFDTNELLASFVMPTVGTKKREYNVSCITSILEAWNNKNDIQSVALERAQAMPKQGVSSMFSIGYGFGVMQGILTALGISYVIVMPKEWQKRCFAGMPKDDTKKSSYLFASRMCPSATFLATSRSRVPHSGLTDAYCMAWWLKNIY